MDTTITWLIIVLFYAPLHYLVPLLVVLVRSNEQQRRGALIRTLQDCTLSMTISFALVFWLVGQERITLAMAALLVSLALPYIRIFTLRADAPPDRQT
jgi:hypothetical protein